VTPTERATRAQRGNGPADGCPAAPARWVRNLERELSVPGRRLRHAVIVGPAVDVDVGYPVLAGKVFVIAVELDGHAKEGDGDVAAWVVGDPYGQQDAYKVTAADRNPACTLRSAWRCTGALSTPCAEAVRAGPRAPVALNAEALRVGRRQIDRDGG
jgi:hypothetical protein